MFLTLVIALALAWWLDRRTIEQELSNLHDREKAARFLKDVKEVFEFSTEDLLRQEIDQNRPSSPLEPPFTFTNPDAMRSLDGEFEARATPGNAPKRN
jgi:hypothetical protein